MRCGHVHNNHDPVYHVPSCRSRRRGHSRRLPDPGAPRPRDAADLSGQRGDLAETAAGDRRADALLRAHQRQRPPRGAYAQRGSDGAVRRRARQAGELRRLVLPQGDHLDAQRQRGDEPGGVQLGPRQPQAGRPRPADRDGAPLEHRAVADPGGRARLRDRLRARGRRRHADPGRPAQTAGTAPSCSASPTCRMSSARSTR